MTKKNYILLFILFITTIGTYAQDGGELILIHSYTNKTAIDNIANPIEGAIAYNTLDNSIYLFDGTNWIADCFTKSITTTTGAGPLLLDENFYTVIIADGTHIIELPPAGDHDEREYVLKNLNPTDYTITGNYLDNTSMPTNIIPAENVLKIQSDGASWHQVNNYSAACSNATTTTGTGTTATPTFTNDITTSVDRRNFRDTNLTGNTLEYGTNTNTVAFDNLEVLIRNVNYNTFDITSATAQGINGQLTDVDVIISDSVFGSGFDILITLRNIDFRQNRNVSITFNVNTPGVCTGGNSTCPGVVGFFGSNN